VRIPRSRIFNTAAAYVPYPVGVGWARWFTGNALARRLFFGREIRSIKDVYEDRCGIRLDEPAVHRLLMANTLRLWWVFKLPKLSDGELDRYVRVKGLQELRALNRSGQGVLLASAHYFGTGSISLVLARRGFDVRSVRRSKPKRVPSYSQAQYVFVGGKNAVTAFKEITRIFRSGGMIHSLFDGLQGTGTVVRPFLGRNCHFRRALGELALREGVAIVPVSVRTELDGCIQIDFDEPLTIDLADVPVKEASEAVIERYAAYLDTAIRTYPWSFDPVRLDLFLRKTSVDEPDNAPSAAAS